jgi:outer membrane protein assembly factor BamB
VGIRSVALRVVLGLLVPLAALTACADDPAAESSAGLSTASPPESSQPAPTPAPSSGPASASIDPATGATHIDTGGTQVVGLALADSAMWAVSYDTSTLAGIDPATNAVVSTIEVPGGASAAGLPSGLWVAAYGNPGHLYRIDPKTGTIALTADVGDLCCDLTEGSGLVWALDRAGQVFGVDPASGEVGPSFPVELDLNAHNNVVFAGGFVWVSSDTTKLFRFDPGTGKRMAFDVGGGVPFLESKDGLLWGATPTGLWAVHPATGEVVERIPLEDSTEVMALAVEGRTAWVGMRHPGSVGAVVEVDLQTGEARREVPVDIPARIQLGFGSVWVSDSGSSDVVRIED